MRNVADGRQQLDRRESDAIIAGQLVPAMIIGTGWARGKGRGKGVHRGMQLRVAAAASYALTYT